MDIDSDSDISIDLEHTSKGKGKAKGKGHADKRKADKGKAKAKDTVLMHFSNTSHRAKELTRESASVYLGGLFHPFLGYRARR